MQSPSQPLYSKPRLLIILNRFVIGGQAVDTIPLAWRLKNDFDILILYGEKEKDEIEPVFLLEKYSGLKLQKMKYLRRSINPLNDVFAFFSILYTIVTYKAHIVHTHGAKSGFIGRLAAWLARVPVIVHTFHGHFFHSYFSATVTGIIKIIEKMLGKITTAAIALSTTQKAELVEKYKILPTTKIKIIQLGFDCYDAAEADIQRQNFRSRYGLQPDDVAIGIVGRIVAVKNHVFFTEVVKTLLSAPSANPSAFFIIGDGGLRSDVEKKFEQDGIQFSYTSVSNENRVVFTSWLTDMDEVMNGLDIIVLTSLNEGTPLSIIEAQFFKKPVVSTNVGGVKDTMSDKITGFLTVQNDVAEFTEKLRLLINDKDLRTEMGEAGYAFASAKFSKIRELDETKNFYFEMLAQKEYSSQLKF